MIDQTVIQSLIPQEGNHCGGTDPTPGPQPDDVDHDLDHQWSGKDQDLAQTREKRTSIKGHPRVHTKVKGDDHPRVLHLSQITMEGHLELKTLKRKKLRKL